MFFDSVCNKLKNWFSYSKIWFLMVMIISLDFMPIIAQNTQLWLDGFAYLQPGINWEYEANIGINKLLVSDGWFDYYFNNTFSFQKSKHLALEGSVELHYTDDPTLVDVLEVRPWVATKLIYPYPYRKINLEQLFLYARLEQRFFWYADDEDTEDQKTRLRLRGGGRFLVNKDIMTKQTIYIPWYIEGFVNFKGDALERYAEQSRVLVGVGYIFSQEFRAELIHITQRSRNTIEDKYTTSDYIFQLQVKYYF